MQRVAADLIRSRGQRLRRQMRVFGRRRGELQRGEPGERGRVEGGDRRAAEILEQHVAEIDRSPMNEDRVAADAGRVRRAHDDAAAKVAHVREEAHHTVRIARAWMAVGERSGQRNDAAADRLYGPFFPPRLPPREIGPVGVGHLPGIGHDQAVPSRPPAQIARHRHGRAAGGQFPRETQERRGAGLADHRDFAECDEAVSVLFGIDRRIDRRVGDHDLHVDGGIGGAAHEQLAIGIYEQRLDRQRGIRREDEGAVHTEARGCPGPAIGDGLAGGDVRGSGADRTEIRHTHRQGLRGE